MPALTRRNKIGLGIAAVLAIADILSLLIPTPEGETGPPTGVLVLITVLGVITLAALVAAVRTGSRTALRVVVGSRILSAITALPAFFVDPPVGLLLLASAGVALTVVCVVLVLAPSGDRVPISD